MTPLRLGDKGRAVALMQGRLGIERTGLFGDATLQALTGWQAQHELSADGVYGPLTNDAMTRRTPGGLQHVADRLRVELPAVQALVEVEAGGKGFLPNGLPKILLERHHVWRGLSPEQRVRLPADVCSKSPGGYIGGLPEWSRYNDVVAVAPSVASMASSWGLPQILGSNYYLCGCLDLRTFVDAMCLNEDAQLDLLGRFISAQGNMLSALRERDWTSFAKFYNGPAQRGYNARLEEAYRRFSAAAGAA